MREARKKQIEQEQFDKQIAKIAQNLTKWMTTMANNMQQIEALNDSLKRTKNAKSKKNLETRIANLQKWNASARKWIDGSQKRLNDM